MTRYKPITEKEARLGRGTESFDEWKERNREVLKELAIEEGHTQNQHYDFDLFAEAKWDEGWGRFTEWTQGAPLGLYSKSFEALQNLPKKGKIFIKNKEGIPVLTVERMEKQLGKAGLKKAEIEGIKDYLDHAKGIAKSLQQGFTKEQIVAASQGVFNKLKDIKVQHIKRVDAVRHQGAGEEAILGGVSADIADYDVVRIYLDDEELWMQSRGVSMMPLTHFGSKTIGWTRATKRKKGDTEKEGYVKFIDELQRDGEDRLIKEPFKSNDYRMALLARLRHEANDPSIDEVALNHMDLVNTMGGINVSEAGLKQWYHPTKGQFVADMRDVAKEFGGKVQYKTYPFLPPKAAPAFTYKNTEIVKRDIIPLLDDAIKQEEGRLSRMMQLRDSWGHEGDQRAAAAMDAVREGQPEPDRAFMREAYELAEESQKGLEDSRRTLQRLRHVREELDFSTETLDNQIKRESERIEESTIYADTVRQEGDLDLADVHMDRVEEFAKTKELLVKAKKEFGDDYHLLNLTKEEVRFLSDLIEFGETPSGLWQPLEPLAFPKVGDDVIAWFDFLEPTGAEAYEVPYITLTDKLRENLLTKPARLFKKEGGLVGQMDRLGFKE